MSLSIRNFSRMFYVFIQSKEFIEEICLEFDALKAYYLLFIKYLLIIYLLIILIPCYISEILRIYE